jgi:Fe-S cluster assembly ATP-binding protein
MTLEVQNLHVRTEEREILHGVDLLVKRGETHALMGPNGSGKSTLANTLMGNPSYEVTEGRILLNGEDLTEADPDERARAGLFMAFQYPATIPGCRSRTSCAWRSTRSATSRSRSRSSGPCSRRTWTS